MPSLGIARTAWLFGSPGRDFPSRILDAAERARAAGEPLRAVSDEWGTPTYTADVADAVVELLADDAVAGIHHLVNGLFATRADWASYVVGSGRDRRRGRAGARGRPGSARRTRRAGACSNRRRCRPASRCGSGRMRWPTTPHACFDRRGRAHEPASIRRPSLPGVRYGVDRPPRGRARLVPRAVARGRLPGRAVRAGEPVRIRRLASCAASTSTVARTTSGSWPTGRAFVALVDVRPLLDGSGSGADSSRPASSGRTIGSSSRRGVAHGFLALDALKLIYLVTNEYDGSDELGLRLGRPERADRLARPRRDPRRTPGAVRS